MVVPHIDHPVDQQKRIAVRDHFEQLLDLYEAYIHWREIGLRNVVHGFQPPDLFDLRPVWASLRSVTTSLKKAFEFWAGAPSTSSPAPTSAMTPDCAPIRAPGPILR